MKNKINIFFILVFVFLISFFLTADNSQKLSTQKTLSPSHSHLKGKDNCIKCHLTPGEIDSHKCINCHIEIKKRIKKGTGYHQDKVEECSGCHVEHSGPDTDLTDFDEKDFDHAETGYLLTGKHKKISDCRKCHSLSRVFPRKKTTSYLLKNNNCGSCHENPHPGIREKCTTCHLTSSWEIDPWDF